jgi:preprotein translocase subunit SecG
LGDIMNARKKRSTQRTMSVFVYGHFFIIALCMRILSSSKPKRKRSKKKKRRSLLLRQKKNIITESPWDGQI